jgi:hypothetical protein
MKGSLLRLFLDLTFPLALSIPFVNAEILRVSKTGDGTDGAGAVPFLP